MSSISKRMQRYKTSLVRYVQLQLCITLFSAPFLIAWNLPLSCASIVGNFIFTPFILLFLLLASLIFFTELLFIPNDWLIHLLDYITRLIEWLLLWGQRSWLVWHIELKWPYILCLYITLFVILSFKRCSRIIATIILLIITSIAYFLINSPDLKLNIPPYLKRYIPLQTDKKQTNSDAQKLAVLYRNGNIDLIDNGVLSTRKHGPAYVRSTLIPHLAKYQITKIDNIITSHITSTTIKSLIVLLEALPVKQLSMPHKKTLSNEGWAAWRRLMLIAKQYNVKILSS